MNRNKRLVAYVVPSQESTSTVNELRDLKAQLPEYMVPSAHAAGCPCH